MKFTDSQFNTITNALRAAADVYAADAETMRATPGHDRLAQQFDKQVAEARVLADHIDNNRE